MSKCLKLMSTDGITYDEKLQVFFLKNSRVIHVTRNPKGMFVDFTRENEVALKSNGNSYILGTLSYTAGSVHFNRVAEGSHVQLNLVNYQGLALPATFSELTYSDLMKNDNLLDQIISFLESFFTSRGLKIKILHTVLLGVEKIVFDVYSTTPGLSSAVYLITPEYGMTRLALKTDPRTKKVSLDIGPLYNNIAKI